ncbi:MAG: hypothetical protein RL571_1142 [Pseudomonadota bacterium]|jgi:hypothetical protein
MKGKNIANSISLPKAKIDNQLLTKQEMYLALRKPSCSKKSEVTKIIKTKGTAGCALLNIRPSSLSDLSDRSEGKTGLRQISWIFEANSWLFNEKMREIWPNPAFP